MIRFTVQTTDYADCMQVGGPAITTLKTFTVDCPEMETHLREFQNASALARESKRPQWWNRQLLGFEIVEEARK